MNRTKVVQAILWLDQLAAVAKAEGQKLRVDLAADARAELEEQGTAPTWRIPDVATVAARVSKDAVRITNEPEFTAWVKERYPEGIETVTRVRNAWATTFLGEAGVIGDVAVDSETGEVVPGLAVNVGGEFAGISITATGTAKQVFAALAGEGLRKLALTASPAVPTVLAELDAVRHNEQVD
jgi:hypothetical protein